MDLDTGHHQQQQPHALRQSRRSTTAATGAAAGTAAPPPATTPLRRISRGSLVALSASRTREADLYGPTLGHLAPAFAELAETIEDLAVNLEALDAINQSLDDFNESFAGLLLGLRANAYTSEFPEAPTLRNFTLDKERQARLAKQAEEEEEQAEAARQAEETRREQEEEMERQSNAHPDDTFVTQAGGNEGPPPPRGGTTARGRGRGRAVASGGGKTAAHKQKDQLIKFAQPIISTMPIDFREKQPQRNDAETVIGALRTHPDGLHMQELVKMYPLIPQHRINDCLLALVRAKHAIKVTSKGLLYRLDPMKYPANT
ncbi:hypothetical protein P389DRAFT_180216 [Cystobasidium minutum MCA 4210]|uniref:uncharacterized protein n=1 Tax=Cystobasidium minutum MCA 4210 TaxID=1397322 RepID=UPI0034CD22EE|eukprot:jgi/Rhomi1/180216/fgenesh1_pg.4_\